VLRNLPKNDFMSKSDPMAVLMTKSMETGEFVLAGVTESLK
jgi:hypothetical protein